MRSFISMKNGVSAINEAVGEYSDLLNALNLVDSNNKFEVLYFEQTYF